jgi:hypothetical protein
VDRLQETPNKSEDPMVSFPIMSPANRKQGDPWAYCLYVSAYIKHFLTIPQSAAVLLIVIKNQDVKDNF